MKEVLKKYTFLVLLASENFLSPNVLKVYFFHASSVLHFTRNFENFQLLNFVKSARSMLKVYFYSIRIFFYQSPKVLKVCFFYASSDLHFEKKLRNFQSVKFIIFSSKYISFMPFLVEFVLSLCEE